MKKTIQIVLSSLLVLMAAGCNGRAEPVQCVCNCDGPPPEGSVVKIAEKKTEAKAAPAAPAASAAPARPATRPAAATPPVRVPRKARGRVSAEPGSGVPKVMSAEDKSQMKSVFLAFATAAKERNIGDMQKSTTERLGKSLEAALEKHKDRLYRRTDLFSVGAEGGLTIGSTNDIGDGNFDIEIKLSSGAPVHVLFFKEEGKWRLNRL